MRFDDPSRTPFPRLLPRLPVILSIVLAALPSMLAETFCIDYSKKPDADALLAHDVSIVSPEADLDLDRLHRAGHRSLAYLSIVEVAHNATYRDDVRTRQIPALLTNATWKSDVMDVSNPAWKAFILDALAPQAMKRPFDGFFLDTVDSVEMLCTRFPTRANEFRSALVQLIQTLRASFPAKIIILNRGFEIAKSLGSSLDGVLIESMFQTVDPITETYKAVPEADTRQLIQKARALRSERFSIYVLDYVHPADARLAETTAARIAAEGFIPFISTPALDGQFLAPVREVPRRLLTLYGNQEQDIANLVRWPVDSVIGSAIQAPIEWLGYEVDYVNPSRDPLPTIRPNRHAGIILDRALRIPISREIEVARWLAKQHQAGHRILFMGVIPFSTEQALEIILEIFKFKGSREVVRPVSSLSTLFRHPQLGFEAALTLQTNSVYHLEAPEGSKPWLSIEAVTPTGQRFRFDPIFTAPWGGAILDPYLFFSAPTTSNNGWSTRSTSSPKSSICPHGLPPTPQPATAAVSSIPTSTAMASATSPRSKPENAQAKLSSNVCSKNTPSTSPSRSSKPRSAASSGSNTRTMNSNSPASPATCSPSPTSRPLPIPSVIPSSG